MSEERNQSEHKAPQRKTLLETSALIVGYAMSRLDKAYLEARGIKNWKAAFADAGKQLRVAPASIKNLRDEFDPVHGNLPSRMGRSPNAAESSARHGRTVRRE